MPAHAQRLTPEQLQVLSAYVWGLSRSKGGAANTAAAAQQTANKAP
jgi:hypothetical protein